jgi:predicted amidophosphoribosyltransferase
MICFACEKLGFFSSGGCVQCMRRVLRDRLPDEDAAILKTLFYYDGPIKDLIVRAKINHDRSCIKLLTQIFIRSSLLNSACMRNDLIMPVPSSLWSRWYGRFDVAAALAYAASKQHSIAWMRPPWFSGWHVKKQSHRKDRVRQSTDLRIDLPNKNILLVDDVKTSGSTLRHLTTVLNCRSVEAITLARAK